jgi:hypothetical protein
MVKGECLMFQSSLTLLVENPGEAISAVKALAKADQQGQKIYHITQANMATVLPNIHHDPLVMDEIKAALAVGKEVTTHTDAVSVPGWSCAGYIIMDPQTGIGAYKIGGGMNGSEFTEDGARKFNKFVNVMSTIWDAMATLYESGAKKYAADALKDIVRVLGKISIFAGLVGIIANVIDLAATCNQYAAMAFSFIMVAVGIATIGLSLLSGGAGLLVGIIVSPLVDKLKEEMKSSEFCT